VTSLDEGIPKAVAWFREHRAAHPDEAATIPSEGEGVGWKDTTGLASSGPRVGAGSS
jgi:hypothetical protein